VPIHRLNGRVIQQVSAENKHCSTSFIEFMQAYTRIIHLSIPKAKKLKCLAKADQLTYSAKTDMM
jgi:hypothetical protein